jgi:hypothetical protein
MKLFQLQATKLPLSAELLALAQDPQRERVSLADLMAALGDRALGALMFVFALPNTLPAPPGTSAILGTPLVLLAAQLMLGLKPWLPRFVSRRSMPRADFEKLMLRVAPWLIKAERLLRPRMSALATPPLEYFVGAICLVLALVIALPIPFGNIPPAIAICLLALGVLERDGLWVLAGMATATAAGVIVWGMLLAMVKAVIYLVTRVLLDAAA